jgi:hypothetical protein
MFCPAGSGYLGRLLFTIALGLCLDAAAAPDVSRTDEAFDFNYVYGAVFGTGYYKTDTERLYMLRIPASFTLADAERPTRFLLPVAIGFREAEFEEAPQSISDDFASISIMPGLASDFRLRDNWQLTPSVQLGAAWDSGNNTSSWVGSAAVRHHAWWDLEAGRLTLAQRLRVAGQHNRDNRKETAIFLVENGVDWEVDTPFHFRDRPLKAGVFFIWQRYINDLKIQGIDPGRTRIDQTFQFGVTLGFASPRKPGWLSLQRLGLSITRGDSLTGNEITAVNISLGFPLVRD